MKSLEQLKRDHEDYLKGPMDRLDFLPLMSSEDRFKPFTWEECIRRQPEDLQDKVLEKLVESYDEILRRITLLRGILLERES